MLIIVSAYNMAASFWPLNYIINLTLNLQLPKVCDKVGVGALLN